MKIECHVEQHEAGGAHRQWTVNLDRSTIAEVFDSLCGAWSVTMSIPGDGQETWVSFSGGMAAVTLAVGGEFYDFVASEPKAGWVNFVHGGQPADHPRRHCLSISEVTAIVGDFLAAGSVSVDNVRWEHQGEYQSA